MERKQVQIKGINRSSQIAQPGECYELINVRRYNKNWLDAKQKKKLKSISQYETIFVHMVNETKHFLSYDIDTGWIYYYEDISNPRPDAGTDIHQIDDGVKVRMQMLGNVVMIFDDTKRLTYYMLWDVEESVYRWIGEINWPMIDIQFNSYIAVNSAINEIDFGAEYNTRVKTNTDRANIIGHLIKGQSNGLKKVYLMGLL